MHAATPASVLHDLAAALDEGTSDSHLPATERAAVRQILLETLPEFAAILSQQVAGRR